MRRSHRSVLAVAVLLTAAIALGPASPASAAGCEGQYAKPTSDNVAQMESAIRCLINKERSKRGMGGLGESGALGTAAGRHSQSMVRGRYFSHTGRDGSSPKSRAKKAGYSGGRIAENITYGTGGYSTPRNVVQRWMASGAHRANMLSGAYDDIGVGVALGNPEGRGGGTFTTKFGG